MAHTNGKVGRNGTMMLNLPKLKTLKSKPLIATPILQFQLKPKIPTPKPHHKSPILKLCNFYLRYFRCAIFTEHHVPQFKHTVGFAQILIYFLIQFNSLTYDLLANKSKISLNQYSSNKVKSFVEFKILHVLSLKFCDNFTAI